MILDTLIFDESQIACPTNGANPKWGGCCHTLTREAGRTAVIIKQTDETDTDTERSGGGGAQMRGRADKPDTQSARPRTPACRDTQRK